MEESRGTCMYLVQNPLLSGVPLSQQFQLPLQVSIVPAAGNHGVYQSANEGNKFLAAHAEGTHCFMASSMSPMSSCFPFMTWMSVRTLPSSVLFSSVTTRPLTGYILYYRHAFVLCIDYYTHQQSCTAYVSRLAYIHNVCTYIHLIKA